MSDTLYIKCKYAVFNKILVKRILSDEAQVSFLQKSINLFNYYRVIETSCF